MDETIVWIKPLRGLSHDEKPKKMNFLIVRKIFCQRSAQKQSEELLPGWGMKKLCWLIAFITKHTHCMNMIMMLIQWNECSETFRVFDTVFINFRVWNIFGSHKKLTWWIAPLASILRKNQIGTANRLEVLRRQNCKAQWVNDILGKFYDSDKYGTFFFKISCSASIDLALLA